MYEYSVHVHVQRITIRPVEYPYCGAGQTSDLCTILG